MNQPTEPELVHPGIFLGYEEDDKNCDATSYDKDSVHMVLEHVLKILHDADKYPTVYSRVAQAEIYIDKVMGK